MIAAVVTSLVPVVIASALLVSALTLVATRNPWVALPVLLDLLLAAGLLRLSATASWRAIATAATIVAIRKLVGLGLAAGRRTQSQAIRFRA